MILFEAFALNLVIENWRLNNHEMISKMLTLLGVGSLIRGKVPPVPR